MFKIRLILIVIVTTLLINLIIFWLWYYLLEYEHDWQEDIEYDISWVDYSFDEMWDLQTTLIDSINDAWKWVVSIAITRDLEVYYEDPFDFFGWSVQEERQEIGWWSWIIVSKEWYVITNKHVIQEARSWSTDFTVITRDWFDYNVSNIWLDPVLDIAVLRIEDENWWLPTWIEPVDLISVDQEILVWQLVIAIWNALSKFQDSATLWIISWKWRQLDDVPADSIYVWLYQTDASINPWNSWWPLMDIWWNVIWINTAISAVGQWIWFSMPINAEFVDSTLEMVQENSEITRPFLWVQHVDINNALARQYDLDINTWVYIQDVVSWAAADNAWLQEWDIILEVGWVEVWAGNTFLYHLFAYKPNDEVEFTVLSWWEKETVNVILDER